LAPRLKDRTSGYTRIIKMGRRFSDNAAMVVMEWVIKKNQMSRLAAKRANLSNTKVKELPSGKKEEKKNPPAGEKKKTKGKNRKG
jgi:hypothetical protein